jgi:hypothetical protein
VAPFALLEDCGASYHAVVSAPRRGTQMFIEWARAEADATSEALREFTRSAR